MSEATNTSAPGRLSPAELKRAEIIERFNATCYLCGVQFESSQLVIDHIIPHSRGGTNAMMNLAAACVECDRRKKDSLLSELEWVNSEVKARYATLRRERGRSKNRLWVFFKRVQLAMIVLALTPERRLDGLIDLAKLKAP